MEPTSSQQEDFLKLLTKHQGRLYAFVFTLLADRDRVSDVFQETNMVLWRKQSEYDRNRDFLPWAFAIARNQVRADRQKQGRDRLTFDDNTIERIEEKITTLRGAEDNRLEALAGCLGSLADPDRALLTQRYTEGLSVKVIAAATRRTANTVAVAIHRLRQSLADCIQNKLQATKG